MKLNKVIAIPATGLIAGLGLAACGTTVVQPPAQSAPKVNINNNNNAAPAPTTPAPVVVVPAAGEVQRWLTSSDVNSSPHRPTTTIRPASYR